MPAEDLESNDAPVAKEDPSGATTTTTNDNDSSSSNNNENKKECQDTKQEQEQHIAAMERWGQWVPMERDLYSMVQLAQLCIMQKVDEMFNESDIPYWLCGGTLMGAIRHGGFIPHDDDIDLECYQKDLDKISTAIALDPPLFTGFVKESSALWEGHPVAKLEFFNGLLFVDIFPRPSPLPKGERYFPSEDEVFPRSRYEFHNIKVWGPNRNNCSSYLDRCYGSDWIDTVCVYNHDFNWWHSAGFNPRKEVLTLKEYNGIVTKAGIQPPVAQATAKATLEQLIEMDLEGFIEKYKSYCFQRTLRRNRAAAEYREKQQEERNRTAGS